MPDIDCLGDCDFDGIIMSLIKNEAVCEWHYGTGHP
jgi:hypothetical protein